MLKAAPTILLVEDNPADSFILKAALDESGLPFRLEIARDGDEALDRIRAVAPDLILLDLNLPRLDGWEVLAILDGDAALRSIPVWVLSSSRAPEDRERATARSGTVFVTKPDGLDEYLALGQRVREFWESARPTG